MAWSYRKRIKIAPGVRLNISKKGVSTSFGIRGASITTGKNGTYLNTGIPGIGIYSRKKSAVEIKQLFQCLTFPTLKQILLKLVKAV